MVVHITTSLSGCHEYFTYANFENILNILKNICVIIILVGLGPPEHYRVLFAENIHTTFVSKICSGVLRRRPIMDKI